MSLRILFADDSVTAQNMGKKILTEAGYEVVAVSNGAAAVKKIAEQKPDIIILDLYMPGYSGLEVCEKVRSSIATIKTPVLLTVGKMEPYKPEEANRVRADGVIIKPFEASDLLAIVKKFEERIGTAPVPAEVVKPASVPEPVEEIVVQPAQRNDSPRTMSKAVVEVPDHMATSSAFSDLLGTDATHMDQFPVPVAPIPSPAESQETSAGMHAPSFDAVVSHEQERVAEPPAVSASAAAEPDTVKIPVYEEPEPNHYEVVPTAAAPIGDIEIPREAGLQESAEQTTRETVADLREPDLMPTAHQMPEPEHIHAVQVMHEPEVAIAPPEHIPQVEEAAHPDTAPVSSEVDQGKAEPAATPSLSEADFEARVAAAMAAYGHTQHPEVAAATNHAPEFAPSTSEPVAVVAEVPAIDNTPEAPVEAAVMGERAAIASDGTGAPETSAFGDVPVSIAPETAAGAEKLEAQAAAAAAGSERAAITASVEAELASAAHSVAQPAGLSEGEHDNIAQAVNRVMERMKENLVEEIVRELKGRK